MRIIPAAWTPEIGAALVASGACRPEDLEQIRMEVENDQAGLYRLPDNDGKRFPGLLVLRTEEDITGRREMVVLCLCGAGAVEVAEALKSIHSRHGARSIRFHTSRPGLGRILERTGFRELERVYRWENGQQ